MRNSKKLLWGAVGLMVLLTASLVVAGRIAVGWKAVPDSADASGGPFRESGKFGGDSEHSFSSSASDFDRILVEGEWTVDIVRSDAFSVEVFHPEESAGHVSAAVEGGTLVLSCDIPDCTDSELKASIAMPSLAGIRVTGAADIGISGFREETMDFAIEGAANLIAEDSSVESVFVALEGIGHVDLSRMKAGNARVDIGGAGWVKLSMDGGILEGGMDGMGRIYYSGPVSEERVKIDGWGKVIRR